MNKGRKKDDVKLVVDEKEVEKKWKGEKIIGKFEKLHEKKMKEYEEKLKKEEKKKEEEGEDSDYESSSSSSSDEDDEGEDELEDGQEYGWGDNVFEPPASTGPQGAAAFDKEEEPSDVAKIIDASNAAISDLEKSTMDAATKAMGKEDAEVFKANQANEGGAEFSIGWEDDGGEEGQVQQKEVHKKEEKKGEKEVEKENNVEKDVKKTVAGIVTIDHSDNSSDDDDEESGGFYEQKRKSPVPAQKEDKAESKTPDSAPPVEIVEVKENITASKLGYGIKFPDGPFRWCRISEVKNSASPAKVNDIVFDMNGIILIDNGVKSTALLKGFLTDHRHVASGEVLPIDVCLLRWGNGGGSRIPDEALREYLGKRRAANARLKDLTRAQAKVGPKRVSAQAKAGAKGAGKRVRADDLPDPTRIMEKDEVKKRKLLLDEDDWSRPLDPSSVDDVIDLTIDSDED